MQPSGNNGVVRYTILDETGPHNVLLFGCEGCSPDKKLTSSMLETHMRTQHEARRFTVSIPPPITNLDAIKDAGVSMKEVIKDTRVNTKEAIENVRRYNRPVPGPRQPRRD